MWSTAWVGAARGAALLAALAWVGCGGGTQAPSAPSLDAPPASFFAPAPPPEAAQSGGATGDAAGADRSGSATSGTHPGSGEVTSGVGVTSAGGAAGPGGPPAARCPAAAVTYGYGRLKVTLEGDVLFAFDKHELKPAARAMLADIKRELIDKHPKGTLTVEGHTDSVGSDAYNDDLSRRRAGSVAGWLAQAGVAAGRLSQIGYGKRHPRVPNDSDEHRALNRRVEIVVIDDAAMKPPPPPPTSACKGSLACCELGKAQPELAAACIGKSQPADGWGADLGKRKLAAHGGALSLTACTTTRSAAVWITSTGEDKVAKLDERDGRELFRIPTYGRFPHRTAVAQDGSVWITNRETGSYVHLAQDGKLLCSSAYKTCYTRAAAVDVDGNAWIGCYSERLLIKVDPRVTSGTVKVQESRKGPEIDVPGCKELARVDLGKVSPYGLVADRRGTLWTGVGGRSPVAQVDARKAVVLRVVDVAGELPVRCWDPYGISIDRDGNPWYANFHCGSAVKLDGRTGKVLGYFAPPPFKLPPPELPKDKPATPDKGKGDAPDKAEGDAPDKPEPPPEPKDEPRPHLRAIGFDRQGHAWLPDNRGDHVYELAPDGKFIKRVDLSQCTGGRRGAGMLGTGSDSEGHMWTVLQNLGGVVQYKTDGTILGCYPNDGKTPKFKSPYTYSDFTGSSMAMAARDGGRVTVRFAHESAVDWRLLALRAVTPQGTTLCFRVRAGAASSIATAAWSELSCVTSKTVAVIPTALAPLKLAKAPLLELELELGSTNPAASPIVHDVSVAAVP